MNSTLLARLRTTLLFNKKQRILCFRPSDESGLSWLRVRRYNVEGPEPDTNTKLMLHSIRPYYDLVLMDRDPGEGADLEKQNEDLREGLEYVRPGGRLLLASSFPEDGNADSLKSITLDLERSLEGLPVAEIKPSKKPPINGYALHLIHKSGVYKPQLPVHYVDDMEAYRRTCEELQEEEMLGLDIETTLNEPRVLCTVQLASTANVYIFDTIKIEDLEPLKGLMENEKILKIIHNRDFEKLVLGQHGIAINNIYDTLVHARKHYKRNEVGSYRLDDVCVRALNIYLDKYYQVSDWTRRPLLPEQIDYAAADAEVMIRLHAHFEPPAPPENLELF
ncbi:MAG: hypothetical protein GX130_08275 [Candidatus Hydrogenedens sp.]|jgi:hypothetical protein|nr:hypothetical protein [Candidatus Hydrogenedens sp.]